MMLFCANSFQSIVLPRSTVATASQRVARLARIDTRPRTRRHVVRERLDPRVTREREDPLVGLTVPRARGSVRAACRASRGVPRGSRQTAIRARAVSDLQAQLERAKAASKHGGASEARIL